MMSIIIPLSACHIRWGYRGGEEASSGVCVWAEALMSILRAVAGVGLKGMRCNLVGGRGNNSIVGKSDGRGEEGWRDS